MNPHDKTSEQFHSFVCLSYKQYDFLFDRSVVTSSMYSGVCTPGQCTRCRIFKNSKVPVFCLDQAVKTMFDDVSGGTAATVIFIEKEHFSKKAQKVFSKTCGVYEKAGIESTAPAKIIEALPSSFSLLPGSTGRILRNKGISAVRFNCNDSIQFLLDLDYLIVTLSEK